MSPDNLTEADPDRTQAPADVLVVDEAQSETEALAEGASAEAVLEQAVDTAEEASVVAEAAEEEAVEDVLVAEAAAEVEIEASEVAEAAEEEAAEDIVIAEAAREVQAEARAEREQAEGAGDLERATDAATAEVEAGALADAAEEAAVENLVVAEAAEEAAEEAAIVSELAADAAEEAVDTAATAEAVEVLAEATADVAAEEVVEEATEAVEAEQAAEAAEAADAAETETETEDTTPAILRGPGEWYVVHTYAGYENKVKANLHSRIGSMQMEEKIFDVVIPMEDVMEIKGGKKQVVQKKVFPGYLLVRMVYDNDSWYVVRNTPGVTGFVSSGTGTKPTPLSPREVEKILAVKKETAEKPQYRLEFDVDDVVRIISGPFADFTGTISEINVEQSKLKVMVNIFDRETPVELAFDQVAKA